MTDLSRLVVAERHRLDGEVLAAALAPIAPTEAVAPRELLGTELGRDVLLLLDAGCSDEVWQHAVLCAGGVGLLHSQDTADLRRRAGHAAVVGCLDRQSSLTTLMRQARRALAGHRAGRRPAAARPSGAPPDLSPREHDVLALMARGLGNRDIAAELAISQHTVRTHVQAVLTKFQKTNRVAAVGAARQAGLIVR